MQRVFYLMIVFISVLCSISAQEESNYFERKGRILIETGYNVYSGVDGGSGISIIRDNDGDSRTNIGFEGGYFLSTDLALKVKFGLLYFSRASSPTTTISLGGKYYIAGIVPIEITAGTYNGGFSRFLGEFNLGYALNLAQNITIEPNAGLLYIEESSIFTFGLSFSMFL